MKLSIVMLAYNHESFIAQALESIVDQKVNFDFELLVGEDCSTDNTRQVLKEYQGKFGQKMNAIFREENIGAKENVMDLLKRCRGEYIAFLEGDDYWIDENKLQRQVDFLDSHAEYICVAHECMVVDQAGNEATLPYSFHEKIINNEFTAENLIRLEQPGQTATVMVRNAQEIVPELLETLKEYTYELDSIMPIFLLKKGKIAVFSEKMSAYRYYVQTGKDNFSSLIERIGFQKNALYHMRKLDAIKAVGKHAGFNMDISPYQLMWVRNMWRYTKENFTFRNLMYCLLLFMKADKKISILKEYGKAVKRRHTGEYRGAR